MKCLFLILVLLLSSACFAGEVKTVRQLSDNTGYLLSESHIPSLETYEAGRQGGLNSMHQVFDVHYYDEYYSGTVDIFYSDESRYGGRYDQITYYWNPPVEQKIYEEIPEPSSALLLLCGMSVLIRRTRRDGIR